MVAPAVFKIGDKSFRVSDWPVFRMSMGRTVYRSRLQLGGGDKPYLWAFNRGDGTQSAYQTPLLAKVNIFLANPTAWEAEENARIIRAHENDWLGDAIDDVAHVVTDVLEFSEAVYLAGFNGLTIDSNGLQLSDHALEFIPDEWEEVAQIATSVAGFGVLGAAAITAVGGIGAISSVVTTGAEVVGGVAGVIEGATGLAGTLGLLPSPAAPAHSVHPSVAAAAASSSRSSSTWLYAAAGLALLLALKK